MDQAEAVAVSRAVHRLPEPLEPQDCGINLEAPDVSIITSSTQGTLENKGWPLEPGNWGPRASCSRPEFTGSPAGAGQGMGTLQDPPAGNSRPRGWGSSVGVHTLASARAQEGTSKE